MADIDFFKIINDKYGHQCGDEAIKKVAEILEQSVRKDDVVIRYGGDEFTIVFFDIKKEDLKNKLTYLESELEGITLVDYPEVHITMSFGAALGTELVSNLIGIADKALYEAKKSRATYTLIEI